MSFRNFLGEQGVEAELTANLSEVVDLLDRAVPFFTNGKYGCQIHSSKGVLGKNWRFMIKLTNLKTSRPLNQTVGFIELQQTAIGTTNCVVEPRSAPHPDETLDSDEYADIFSSFILHILKEFHVQDLIRMPGQFPPT